VPPGSAATAKKSRRAASSMSIAQLVPSKCSTTPSSPAAHTSFAAVP
jgi:hypothetical protein